jgi:alpha-amylase
LYEANGFNSMVNMLFPKDGDLTTIVQTWQAYSDSMAVWQAAGYAWYPFSYLNNAYFREADSTHMDRCATCFLLSPGAVQIFYGDEVNRKTSDAILNVDAAQGFRSDYDWSASNDTLLTHYRTLCAFRKNHPAVGAGSQTMLNSMTVVRTLGNDTVVIALNPQAETGIPVPFADGMQVRNAYSGETATVQNGQVVLQHPCGHVALIENMGL